MWATTTFLPSTVSHLPLTPVATALEVTSEIFLLAKSIEQRRSSQLKSAMEPFVRIQRLGVPYFEVSKLFTLNVGAITAVRSWFGFGIVTEDAVSHIANALLVLTESATS